jgi:exopolysaccharide biosynthesis polyprenyl glycosylphosphotransferase
MYGQGAQRERAAAPASGAPRRHSGNIVRLPVYDVRVRRELAHRRFVVSAARQLVRIITLHAMDAFAVIVAFSVARGMADPGVSTGALPALIAFMLIGLNVRGSYRAGAARRDSQRLLTGVLVASALIALAATLPHDYAPSMEFIVAFGLACVAAILIERRFVDALVHQAYVHGYGLRRALIVARSYETTQLLAGLVPSSDEGPAVDHMVVGYLSPEPAIDANSLGTLADLERVLEEKDISELLVGTSLGDETLTRIAETCFETGVRVLVIPPAPNTLRGWAELTHVGRWPAYQLHPARLELPALILKRASDLILASIGLVLTSPLMLLIGLAIKIESRGPVFFRQRRVGLGGREFMMWKFRSMTREAELQQQEIAHLNAYDDPRLFKLPRDPRITRVGRLLRRFSLDELPQLFNILAGDMSLVGPRPPLPSEVKRYESHHLIRLSVVPGLTGPWQVNGRNLITNFEEVVRLERDYIEQWSLRSDIEIIVRTLGVVISGKGAY